MLLFQQLSINHLFILINNVIDNVIITNVINNVIITKDII